MKSCDWSIKLLRSTQSMLTLPCPTPRPSISGIFWRPITYPEKNTSNKYVQSFIYRQWYKIYIISFVFGRRRANFIIFKNFLYLFLFIFICLYNYPCDVYEKSLFFTFQLVRIRSRNLQGGNKGCTQSFGRKGSHIHELKYCCIKRVMAPKLGMWFLF